MKTQPDEKDLREAFQSGFKSIDDGRSFYVGFSTYLEALGYRLFEDAPCGCSDCGSHGHQPECRWLK
mgnify:CR=1 FL=1